MVHLVTYLLLDIYGFEVFFLLQIVTVCSFLLQWGLSKIGSLEVELLGHKLCTLQNRTDTANLTSEVGSSVHFPRQYMRTERRFSEGGHVSICWRDSNE